MLFRIYVILILILSFDLAQDGESFDFAQDREPVENPELVEVVERPAEPFRVSKFVFRIYPFTVYTISATYRPVPA